MNTKIDTQVLDTKVFEAEKIYTILSKRIVEFGKHTHNTFSSQHLIKEYILQQDKILELLVSYKKSIKSEYNKHKNSQTLEEYASVLLLQEKRVVHLINDFTSLSMQTKALSKWVISGKDEEQIEIIFKNNSVIEEIKNKLKKTQSLISLNRSFKSQYAIDITLDDEFEASIETWEYLKVIRDHHRVLSQINNIYNNISKYETVYKDLYKKCLAKDKDFYEEILTKDYFTTVLDTKLSKSHTIRSLDMINNGFNYTELSELKKLIYRHVKLINIIDSLYDLHNDFLQIQQDSYTEGGYIKELFISKKEFVHNIQDIFPDTFTKHNAANYTGFAWFFSNILHPMWRDNIKLSDKEKDTFFNKLESIWVTQLWKDISFLISLQKILSDFEIITDYNTHLSLTQSFFVYAQRELLNHKKSNNWSIGHLKKMIRSYARPVIWIITILTEYTYKPGKLRKTTMKKLEKFIQETYLSETLNTKEEKQIYKEFRTLYTKKKKRYHSSSSSSSSWGSSSSWSSSSSSSSSSYSSSGWSSW